MGILINFKARIYPKSTYEHQGDPPKLTERLTPQKQCEVPPQMEPISNKCTITLHKPHVEFQSSGDVEERFFSG